MSGRRQFRVFVTSPSGVLLVYMRSVEPRVAALSDGEQREFARLVWSEAGEETQAWAQWVSRECRAAANPLSWIEGFEFALRRAAEASRL